MRRALNWLTTNRTLAVLWLGLIAWIWSLVSRMPGFAWGWVVVVTCVVCATGVLLRQEWARRLAVVVLTLYTLNTTVRMFTSGWKTSRLFIALGAAFVAWGLWRDPDEGWFEDGPKKKGANDDDDEPETLISLVLLRTRERYLEPVVLAQALSDAWGVRLTAHSSGEAEEHNRDDDGSDGFVAESGPVYIVFVTKPFTAFFLVHNHEGNYFDEAEELADKVPNLRFAEVIRNHQAWLSVDLLNKSSSEKAPEQAYRFIGKAISALADDDTLAMFCPQHSYFNLWNEALEKQLWSATPLKAFEEEVKAPIIGVKDGQGIEEAIAEARRRWPEFVEAFQRRNKEGPPFLVKAPFTTGENTEHMWMEVFGLEPEYVHGHLVNDPFYHPKLRKGSQVEVPVSEVSDWIFAENQQTVGNFTARVVRESERGGAGGGGEE